jgi:hypothetical protein
MNDKKSMEPRDEFASWLGNRLSKREPAPVEEAPPGPRAPRPDRSQGSSSISRPTRVDPGELFGQILRGQIAYSPFNNGHGGADTYAV